jgi:hypothetical protein
MSERRMTRADALKVLIREAAKAVAGSGVGIREDLTESRRMDVARAVQRLHREAYGFEAGADTFFNAGLPNPESAVEP